MIAEGFKYVKSVQADYERVPEGKNYGLPNMGWKRLGMPYAVVG